MPVRRYLAALVATARDNSGPLWQRRPEPVLGPAKPNPSAGNDRWNYSLAGTVCR